MDKFTIKTPDYEHIKWNKQYLSFFIWDNKVYPVGAMITLTFSGHLRWQRRSYSYVTLRAHYFWDAKEYWDFEFHSSEPERRNNYTRCVHELISAEGAPYIESVDAEPISIDCTEYLQFMEECKRTFYDNHLTKEEHYQFSQKIQRGWSETRALPERFKGRDLEELGLAPEHGSFTAPGAIGTWVLFIILLILTNIFKDWYMQLIAKAFVIWWMSVVIQKKEMGIRLNIDNSMGNQGSLAGALGFFMGWGRKLAAFSPFLCNHKTVKQKLGKKNPAFLKFFGSTKNLCYFCIILWGARKEATRRRVIYFSEFSIYQRC